MREIRETILAYIAGFLDGDGSISIRKRVPTKGRPNKTPVFFAYLRFANTNREILEFIRSHFGGHLYVNAHKKPKHKTLYMLDLRDLRATNAIKAFLPFLKIKAKEAGVALMLRQRIDTWKRGSRLTRDEVNKREKLYQLCRKARSLR